VTQAAVTAEGVAAHGTRTLWLNLTLTIPESGY
jgi:hypothetical protein